MCLLAPILGVCVLPADEGKGYKQRTTRAPFSTYVRHTPETIEISLVQIFFLLCIFTDLASASGLLS